MQQGHPFTGMALPYADVMELVDMQDLGSCAVRRGGSSPFIRTT
ncbi:succinyl-diaminopimelate desuccinylase [Rickettsia rickettsii str. Arizona]|uniref:Succinyl-diaminopimelate desuccinylase n=1 Tax=Rickettsia rickettsii (strain Sheila Smith) TaxID=392021 RepID=A0A0H3AZT0_RICRS|nr:succinyl-diaminopimelate desuccinylase [Rickettsia rickettsii str. 'Sheila Smith']AFB22856.1 succinyl-diaminopimelate desuccinylase [Rickettsia rickettsii str. Brazil]AFB24257.1 succinyl-diaminopimelate desuccinylase [Rickettsia rickettsii str. Colombia]AFB25600.1 succinyl-diaminopimelate desuccinylase [Rickettsia rickettsii str. Arizona]AFB28280.1 succinyl-diaminopimelate desuccinylase [Rickettsia rickettsii str. Hino]AFB29605.1 succinyl-diaminopimelate desuccinylase [Rickettsia rickettsii